MVRTRPLGRMTTPLPARWILQMLGFDDTQGIELFHQGDLPAPLGMNSLYGGHILYTSGTTGSYKKLIMTSDQENKRNAKRMGILFTVILEQEVGAAEDWVG